VSRLSDRVDRRRPPETTWEVWAPAQPTAGQPACSWWRRPVREPNTTRLQRGIEEGIAKFDPDQGEQIGSSYRKPVQAIEPGCKGGYTSVDQPPQRRNRRHHDRRLWPSQPGPARSRRLPQPRGRWRIQPPAAHRERARQSGASTPALKMRRATGKGLKRSEAFCYSYECVRMDRSVQPRALLTFPRYPNRCQPLGAIAPGPGAGPERSRWEWLLAAPAAGAAEPVCCRLH